jgi:hypothetical protein
MRAPSTPGPNFMHVCLSILCPFCISHRPQVGQLDQENKGARESSLHMIMLIFVHLWIYLPLMRGNIQLCVPEAGLLYFTCCALFAYRQEGDSGSERFLLTGKCLGGMSDWPLRGSVGCWGWWGKPLQSLTAQGTPGEGDGGINMEMGTWGVVCRKQCNHNGFGFFFFFFVYYKKKKYMLFQGLYIDFKGY